MAKLAVTRTVWGLTGVRTEKLIQACGREGGDQDQTLAVRTKRSKGSRDPQGKDKLSEGTELRKAGVLVGCHVDGDNFGGLVRKVKVGLAKF